MYPQQSTWQSTAYLSLWWRRKGVHRGQTANFVCATSGGHAVRQMQQALIEAGAQQWLPMRPVGGALIVNPSSLRSNGKWDDVTMLCLYLASQRNGARVSIQDALRADLQARRIGLTTAKYALVLTYHGTDAGSAARWDDVDVPANMILPGYNQTLAEPSYDADLRVWDPAREQPEPDPTNPPGTTPGTRPPVGGSTPPRRVPIGMPSSVNSTQQEAGVMGFIKTYPIASTAIALGTAATLAGLVYEWNKSKTAPAKPSRALPARTQ